MRTEEKALTSPPITADVTMGSYWAGWLVRNITFYRGRSALGVVASIDIDGMIAALQDLKQRIERGEGEK